MDEKIKFEGLKQEMEKLHSNRISQENSVKAELSLRAAKKTVQIKVKASAKKSCNLN